MLIISLNEVVVMPKRNQGGDQGDGVQNHHPDHSFELTYSHRIAVVRDEDQ
jgi:hypothetical protein